MSLHSSQISAGINPHFINRPKITQPRQKPANASRLAATVSPAINTYDTVGAPSAHATDAPTVNTAPIPCANRFGGPGTNRCSRRMRGVMNRVTMVPHGLSVGPVHTRATKPYVNGTRTHHSRTIRNNTDCATAPAATNRAEVSFTGFGKLNSPARTGVSRGRDMPSGYGRIPDPTSRLSTGGRTTRLGSR